MDLLSNLILSIGSSNTVVVAVLEGQKSAWNAVL